MLRLSAASRGAPPDASPPAPGGLRPDRSAAPAAGRPAALPCASGLRGLLRARGARAFGAIAIALSVLATSAPARAQTSTCPEPDLTDRTEVWSGTVTVGSSGTTFGFDTSTSGATHGALSDTEFDLGSATHTIDGLIVNNMGTLGFSLTSFLPSTLEEMLKLHVCGTANDLDAAGQTISRLSTYFWTSTGLDWSAATTIEAALSAPAPTVSIAGASATEGSAIGFTVRLSEPTAYDVTVSYTASTESDDTALGSSGTDYMATTGTVTIEATETEATFSVLTTGDTLDEDNETFTVTLTSSSLGFENIEVMAKGTIEDNDDPQTFLGGTVPAAGEAAGDFEIPVTIVASGRTVSMDWTTADGTATAGEDFTAASGTLTFPPGDTEKTITVTIVDDLLDEEDKEDFSIQFSNPSNITAQNASIAVIIEDNEAQPKATLELSLSPLPEDGGSSMVTATLDGASSVETTITVTASPVLPAVSSDFELSSNKVLTIAAGQKTSTGTVTIEAHDNDVYEPGKTVTVAGTVQNTIGVTAPESLTLGIDEDESQPTTVTLSLDKTVVAENETSEAARRVTVTARLDTARPEATDVEISVSGHTASAGDFTEVQDFTITIPATVKSATETFLLAPVNDITDEPHETVTVTATTDAAGLTVEPAQGLTVTIRDDDDTPVATLALSSSSISENGGSSTVTASLDRPSSEETTITVTASPVSPAESSEFMLSPDPAVLTIAAGALTSTGPVTVTAQDDMLADGTTEVTVSGQAVNSQGITGPDDAVLTIADDESASTQVNLTVSPESMPEDTFSAFLRVTAKLIGDRLATDTVIKVQVQDDTAVAGQDFTAVPVSFDITIPANQRSSFEDFRFTPIDDRIDETNETVLVVGTAPGLQVNPATVAIEDNDPTPTMMLVLTPTSISESGGTSTVTASLDRLSSKETTITVSAVSPASADDFILSEDRILTIAAGELTSTGTVTITAQNNDVASGDTTVTVSGAAENALGIEQPGPVTLTITDNDSPSGSATVTISPKVVSEGTSEEVTITATLDAAPLAFDVNLEISLFSTTAISGEDYVEVNDFVLTIEAGQRSGSATFTFTAVDDGLYEQDEETVAVLVNNPVENDDEEYIRPIVAHGTWLTITNIQRSPRVSLVLSFDSIGENGGSTEVVAIVWPPSFAVIDIEVSASPVSPAVDEDFVLTGSTLRIEAGMRGSSESELVWLTAQDNSVYQTGKAVTIRGVASSSAEIGLQPNPVSVTIVEDDTKSSQVELLLSKDTVREDATGSDREVTVTARLDNAARPNTTEVTVTGTGAAEVQPVNVTILPGETAGMATLTLEPLDDNIDAPNRTVTVRGMTTSRGLALVPENGLTVTVEDDELTPVATLVLTPDQIRETNESSTVTATLTGPSSEATTLMVSAEAGGVADDDDFTLSGSTLTIAAGQTTSTGSVTIASHDNMFAEAAKSVTVSASAQNTQGVTGPDDVILPITDDESPSTAVVLAVSPASVPEGAGASGRSIEVTASLDGAALMSDRP